MLVPWSRTELGVRGTGPAYFEDICVPVADITGRAHVHSAERHDMLVPWSRTELGRRSFHVAAPTVWNSLLAHLYSTSINRGQLRNVLMTQLFTQTYA